VTKLHCDETAFQASRNNIAATMKWNLQTLWRTGISLREELIV